MGRPAGLLVAAVVALALAGTSSAGTSSWVICHTFTGGNENDAPFKHPRSCYFAVRNGTPMGIYVRGMAWHGWGGAHPSATGEYRGNMGSHHRTRIVLGGKQRCPGYGFFYTKMRMDGTRILLDRCG